MACRAIAHRADADFSHAGSVGSNPRLAFLLVGGDQSLRRHAEKRICSLRRLLRLSARQRAVSSCCMLGRRVITAKPCTSAIAASNDTVQETSAGKLCNDTDPRLPLIPLPVPKRGPPPDEAALASRPRRSAWRGGR